MSEVVTTITPEELTAIPVLDFEPGDQHQGDDDWKGKCHLLVKNYGRPLCECPSTYGLPLELYVPGPTCHRCDDPRCEKCVAVLEAG